jgi:hypothetical protein
MLSTPEEPINIKSIIFGRYEIGTWYNSQYPEEYGRNLDRMYICEHCLKYMLEESTLRVHKVGHGQRYAVTAGPVLRHLSSQCRLIAVGDRHRET